MASKTTRNFVLNLFSRVFFALASVSASFFLIRYLGPDRYGVMGLYSAALGSVSAFGTFGLIDSIAALIAKKEGGRTIVTWGLIRVSFLALVCSTVFILARKWVSEVL